MSDTIKYIELMPGERVHVVLPEQTWDHETQWWSSDPAVEVVIEGGPEGERRVRLESHEQTEDMRDLLNAKASLRTEKLIASLPVVYRA